MIQGEYRRSIHIKLLDSTHTALRIQSFRHKLSVQEMMEEFAQRIVSEDPVVMKIIHEMIKMKKNNELRRISSSDIDTIYEMIESD